MLFRRTMAVKPAWYTSATGWALKPLSKGSKRALKRSSQNIHSLLYSSAHAFRR